MKTSWWAIAAVVAAALPALADVPSALVSLVDGPARVDGAVVAHSVAVAAVPDPLTGAFTRITSSGLPILAPAVAFLVPVRHRRRALVAAGIVLGALIATALAVASSAATGDAIEAALLSACYAGSLAASVRAYRPTAAEEPA